MRGCARWRRCARERIHASHTHLASLARGRKAERLFVGWQTSGGLRGWLRQSREMVSSAPCRRARFRTPRASSPRGKRAKLTNDTCTVSTVYRRFSLEPCIACGKRNHRCDFLSECGPSVNRCKFGLVPTSATSTIDRDEYRNSERTRLQSGYISVAGTVTLVHAHARSVYVRGKWCVCVRAAGRHIMSNGGDCARAPWRINLPPPSTSSYSSSTTLPKLKSERAVSSWSHQAETQAWTRG